MEIWKYIHENGDIRGKNIIRDEGPPLEVAPHYKLFTLLTLLTMLTRFTQLTLLTLLTSLHCLYY